MLDKITYPAHMLDGLLELEGEDILEIRVEETVDYKVGARVQD